MDFAVSEDQEWGNPGPTYSEIQNALQAPANHSLSATEAANRIFGFNGWLSELREAKIVYMEDCGGYDCWKIGVTATVRVTLKDGTYHDGTAWGCGRGEQGSSVGSARSYATAEALRQALRQFGSALER